MIKEIKNKRFKYQIDTKFYKVYLINKNDAIKIRDYYKNLLNEIETFVYDNYVKVLFWYKQYEKKNIKIDRSISNINNSVHHVLFNVHADKERLLIIALLEYCYLSDYIKDINYCNLLLQELQEFVFYVTYKSKKLIVGKN